MFSRGYEKRQQRDNFVRYSHKRATTRTERQSSSEAARAAASTSEATDASAKETAPACRSDVATREQAQR